MQVHAPSHFRKRGGVSNRAQFLEQELVRVFPFHDFEPVQNLPVTCAFPNGEDHGFAEPAFDRELREHA
jgi:hypothetical protein